MIEYTVKVDISGTKEWYLSGQRHRTDGAAVEHANGGKEWWINGQLHREDGPAVEYADGDKEWWLNGTYLTEQEWLTQIKPQSCAGKIVTIDGKKYRLTEI